MAHRAIASWSPCGRALSHGSRHMSTRSANDELGARSGFHQKTPSNAAVTPTATTTHATERVAT